MIKSISPKRWCYFCLPLLFHTKILCQHLSCLTVCILLSCLEYSPISIFGWKLAILEIMSPPPTHTQNCTDCHLWNTNIYLAPLSSNSFIPYLLWLSSFCITWGVPKQIRYYTVYGLWGHKGFGHDLMTEQQKMQPLSSGYAMTSVTVDKSN